MQIPSRPHAEVPGASDATNRTHLLALGAVTLLALILRLINLNSDLWLDEVASLRRFGDASIWQILTTYTSTNNHLLNSVLVRAAVGLFGHQEWAVRLPAVTFGVLGVPALYVVGRQILRPYPALAAALMLAVSYHHIYFSQNARGYTGYLLFGLLATLSLVRGLRHDDVRWWAAYIGASVLCTASHLIGVFVLVGHGLVALSTLVPTAREGGWPSAGPKLRRLVVVYGILGALLLLMYAAVLRQALVVVGDVYANPGAGFQPLSAEFLTELLHGFSLGPAPWLLGAGLLGGLLGSIGSWSLMRRHPVLLLALCAGPALHLVLTLARGLVFSPRFLLILIFPVCLIAVQALQVAAAWIGAPGTTRARHVGQRAAALVQIAAVALVCLVFVLPLRSYYSVPKQAYRAAIDHARALDGNALVVAIHLTELGVRYYATDRPQKSGFEEGRNLVYVRSVEALDAALAEAGARPTILLTTLERSTRLENADLYARIRRGWRVERTFAGSVGDGRINVWVAAE